MSENKPTVENSELQTAKSKKFARSSYPENLGVDSKILHTVEEKLDTLGAPPINPPSRLVDKVMERIKK